MAKLKKYTPEQTKIIDTAWHLLMRSVESSILQEKRITDAFKADVKDFGNTATRAHIMSYVSNGLRPLEANTLMNLSGQRNEIVLCYMVGQHLVSTMVNPGELAAELLKASEAEVEAQKEFFKTLVG